MNIKTLWATRVSDPGGPPELLAAWDEISMEDNLDGANGDFRLALSKMGDDLDEFRYVEISIPSDLLSAVFEPTHITIGEAR